MMCRVFFVVLVLALLCCCSCVFAAKEEEEQQPQVTQVNAECAGDGNVARWQLPGKSLWYNCTAAFVGFGQMICGMGVGNCASEASQSRTKGVAKDGVFTINVSTFTQNQVKNWWERNVEKDVTVASVPAKPPAALTPGPQEHKAPGDATKKNSVSPTAGAEVAAGAPSLAEAPGGSGEIVPAKPLEGEPPSPQEDKISRETSSRPDSESSSAVVENSTDVPPPPPPPATPGGAGANSAAGAAATTDTSAAALGALDPAPSGDPQGAAHSASAASPAPESIPDPEPTEGGDHSSHEPPVELREETAAAPPNQLSQTGEEGGAAGGTEEDTAANTTDTASSEVNSTAASMPAPLSSAPKKNALENSVGTDACFHGTRLRALPPLFLAALTYGTLG
ncbi:putative serine-alanine-and proline-rich protein [Trypanosoma cruzi]|nr:putative serine-alanine-and proline-rich protein [Trypanosoma cruzi]